jgi:hypothetical protein
LFFPVLLIPREDAYNGDIQVIIFASDKDQTGGLVPLDNGFVPAVRVKGYTFSAVSLGLDYRSKGRAINDVDW